MHNTPGQHAHIHTTFRPALTSIADRAAIVPFPLVAANDELPVGPAPTAEALERARNQGILREQLRGGV
jgi:hypothetical protein